MHCSQTSTHQRISYLDIFRALGIILMIMGHIGFGNKFDHLIHAFHMPMFFFISGFLHTSRPDMKLGSFVAKKSKSFLIPYVFFGLAHFFLVCLLDGFSTKPLLHLLFLNTSNLPIAGALWFLTALYFTDILYFILDKLKMKFLILPLVLIGSFADQVLPHALPWAMSASFVGLGLYWCGHVVRKHEKSFRYALNIPWYLCPLLIILATGLFFFNGYVNMRQGRYACLPLFWLNALLAIFIGISVSKVMDKWLKHSPIKTWLTSIGQNSIVYVCLNQLVILFVVLAVRLLSLPPLLGNLVVLLLTLVLLSVASLIFTRTKLRLFIGK